MISWCCCKMMKAIPSSRSVRNVYISAFEDFILSYMKRTHCSVYCTDIKRRPESINLSAVYFLLPLHYMYSTLYSELCRAQRSSPGRLTCFPWNVYSDALPECLAAGELSGLFRPRQHFTRSVFAVWFPPLVLACSLLDTEGSKEEKTKWGGGAGTGINCPSQGSI